MNKTIKICAMIGLILFPIFVSAEETSKYADCRKACAGDGLSCVNKCMEADSSSSSTTNKNSSGNNLIVVESDETEEYEENEGRYNREKSRAVAAKKSQDTNEVNQAQMHSRSRSNNANTNPAQMSSRPNMPHYTGGHRR
jgi:hypothetical protein